MIDWWGGTAILWWVLGLALYLLLISFLAKLCALGDEEPWLLPHDETIIHREEKK